MLMRLDNRGIPSAVLKGKDPKYIKVYNLYRALMAREIMTRINESFWARAESGIDILGNEWDPLKPKTISLKRKLAIYLREWKLFRNWYKSITGWNAVPTDAAGYEGQRERGLLNPQQRKTFEQAYRIALGSATSSYAKKVAIDAAWAAVQRNDNQRDFVDLINVRTGRLVAATAPGTVVGGRYYAPPDQKFSLHPFEIDISSVEYATEVDAVREIIPGSIDVWVQESHEAIIDEVKALYVDMQSYYASRRKQTKRKSSSRKNNRNPPGRGNNPTRR